MFDISQVDFSYNKADMKADRRGYRTGVTFQWEIVDAEVAPTKADDKLMLKLKAAAVNGETNEPMKLTVFHNVTLPVSYKGNKAPDTKGIWVSFLGAVDSEDFAAFGSVTKDPVTGKKVYTDRKGNLLDNVGINAAMTERNIKCMDALTDFLAKPSKLVGLRFFASRDFQKGSTEYQEMRDVSATAEDRNGTPLTVCYDPAEMFTK